MNNYPAWIRNEYDLWVLALQESLIDRFKENLQVIRMLGEVDPLKYIDKIGQYPSEIIDLIKAIDNVGRKAGPVSGTALRMLYYAEKVLKIGAPSIVEIGGGVGEFYALLRAIGYGGDYMILDLRPVMEFQQKYLAEVARQTGLNLDLTYLDQYDTCVSLHALGEFDDAVKEYYVREVVNKCAHGFIIWNPHSGASTEIPFPCRVSPEYPMNHPDCKQLEW
jgi:SAM-dependent methyltransferase